MFEQLSNAFSTGVMPEQGHVRTACFHANHLNLAANVLKGYDMVHKLRLTLLCLQINLYIKASTAIH